MQGPLLTALWSADKDNVDDKWNISRTKEIPCFIVQRKPPVHSGEQGLGHMSAGRRGREKSGVQ